MNFKTILKRGSLGLLGAFVIAQFFQVGKTNPPVESDFIQAMNPPQEVAQMLRDACYDCHSNETVYPWYTYIVPVGQWIKGHINEGREHLNFSTWNSYSAEDKSEILHESAEEIEKGKMPLGSYTWTHSKARLSDAQKQTLVGWFESFGGGEHEEH